MPSGPDFRLSCALRSPEKYISLSVPGIFDILLFPIWDFSFIVRLKLLSLSFQKIPNEEYKPGFSLFETGIASRPEMIAKNC